MLKIISTSGLRLLFFFSIYCLLTACTNPGTTALVESEGTGKTLVPFAQLAAMDWQLVSLRRGQDKTANEISHGISVKRYRLDFTDDGVRLSGGCNSLNGSLKITAPGKVQIGPMVMTNRGCNTKLMQADAEIGRTLSYVTHYRLMKDQLVMLGAKRILLFKGVAKANSAARAKKGAGSMSLRKTRFW